MVFFEGLKADILRMIRDRRSYEVAKLKREVEEIEREIERKLAHERLLDHQIARLEFETSAKRVRLVNGGAQ